MTYAMEFDSVSKSYRLGEIHNGLREAIPALLRSLTRKSRDKTHQELWALRNVSFQISPGEAVGIIGPNGAGKTTTLKLATSVTQPTSGQIRTRGRMSALIELGAGFHPDLTGRENIYLNGTILGLTRQEIQQRFDEIVAFSELKRFLETPVKRYSSGMYARLGFSVAAHVNPDILIIDEVLAVGDLAFQAKCLARMAQMKKTGTTIIIVSHSLGRVSRLCDRAILLHQGQIVVDGDVDNVIATYQGDPRYASNLQDLSQSGTDGQQASFTDNSPAAITGVAFLDGHGQPVDTCKPGDRLVVRISYRTIKCIENPIFEAWFHMADGTPYAQHTTDWDKFPCDWIDGEGHIDLVIDPVSLVPGKYTFSAALTAPDGITRYDWHWRRYWLSIQANHFVEGFVFLPHEWELGSNRTAPCDGKVKNAQRCGNRDT